MLRSVFRRVRYLLVALDTLVPDGHGALAIIENAIWERTGFIDAQLDYFDSGRAGRVIAIIERVGQ